MRRSLTFRLSNDATTICPTPPDPPKTRTTLDDDAGDDDGGGAVCDSSVTAAETDIDL